MNIDSFMSALPELTIAAILVAAIAGTIIVYALFKKGDVSAEFSHGSTTFRLSAKDRPPRAVRSNNQGRLSIQEKMQ